jgi:tetratricopeptide (TPR) repeat protein/predicted Ser/Thr protein kinase
MGGRDQLRPDEFETVVDGTSAAKAVSDSNVPSSRPLDSDQMTIGVAPGSTPSDSHQRAMANGSDSPTLIDAPLPRATGSMSLVDGQALFLPGAVLGQRYEILQVLGRGGMGAVYKARDREVNRIVALKVIRPDLAGNTAMLDRFKQELVLSHQVTHKNVVRIYDLGEADGVKFITMEYIEGSDLRSIILETKHFAFSEAVEVMLQVCRAIEAVHAVGVIHRDLKPQNIMRDKNGRVIVMDFGLARLLESNGMTQTGALVGTMEYMSPEQALGSQLDHRSDIFTLGLIFYELLSGKMPFAADSALASLIKRTQERAIPVSQHDKNIPSSLANVVSKCMERDPRLRYQNCTELLHDLEAWQGNGAGATLGFHASVGPWARTLPWPIIGLVTAVIVVAVAGYLLRERLFSPGRGTASAPVNAAPVSVLVADFQNNTSDPIFDGTLEPMFNVALEGASFIDAFNRGKARRLAEKLPNFSNKFDEEAAKLIARSEGINAIVTGSISKNDAGYELSVKAIDALTGRVLATKDLTATDKDHLMLDVAKVAVPIRQALGDTTPESVQLAASEGTFQVKNLEAAHQYSTAMDEQAAGNMEEALKAFKKATELDSDFARAYAGAAAVAGNLGHLQDAQDLAKQAMQHVDRMTERERYFVRGMYYARSANWQKCVEEYGDLVKQYPADQSGANNLATCYAQLHNMSKAMEVGQHALRLAPKDAAAHLNFALYSCYATAFEGCEREAREVFKLNPKYEEGFVALAYSQTGESQLSQARETYQNLEKVSPWGSSLAASGYANLALLEGRFREAAQILEKGAAADVAAKRPDSAADKFVMLSNAQLMRRDAKAAVFAAEKALANSSSVKIRFLAARTFVEAGETAKAKKVSASLAAEVAAEPQTYAKLILGEMALKQHDTKQAIQSFSEANQLLDTWIGRFDLGRAYLEAGALPEADSELDRCLKRRGEAVELFMDDMPTYSYVPAVYYYQGRVREGLKSPDFANFYRTYLSVRGKSAEDPLIPEIRRRIG